MNKLFKRRKENKTLPNGQVVAVPTASVNTAKPKLFAKGNYTPEERARNEQGQGLGTLSGMYRNMRDRIMPGTQPDSWVRSPVSQQYQAQQPVAPVIPGPVAPIIPEAPQDFGQGMQDYTSYDSGYNSYETGAPAYDMPQFDTSFQNNQPNELNVMFGPDVNNMNDLITKRQQLAKMAEASLSGVMPDDETVSKALTGLSKSDLTPEQWAQVQKVASGYFSAPLSHIDSYLATRGGSGSDTPYTDSFYGSYGQSPDSGFNPDNVVMNMIGSMPTDKRSENFLRAYQSSPDKVAFVRNAAYASLAQADKEKTDSFGQMATVYSELDNFLNENPDLKTTYLNNKIQDLGKLVGRTQDPRLSKLYQLLGYAQAQYRNQLFGASLTPGEQSSADKFLVSEKETIQGALNKIQQGKNYFGSMYKNYPFKGYGVNPLKDFSVSSKSNGMEPYDSHDGVNYYMHDDGLLYTYPKASGTASSPKVSNIQDAMRRIARNESDGSGGYSALGPVVTSGMYKGQRALGKYQVMEGNIPSWTKEAFGQSYTPQQFYSSPQMQDALANYKLNQYYQKYGNWGDAAAAWFSGGSLAKNQNKKDVLGTSTKEYVNKFLS